MADSPLRYIRHPPVEIAHSSRSEVRAARAKTQPNLQHLSALILLLISSHISSHLVELPHASTLASHFPHWAPLPLLTGPTLTFYQRLLAAEDTHSPLEVGFVRRKIRTVSEGHISLPLTTSVPCSSIPQQALEHLSIGIKQQDGRFLHAVLGE